MRWGWWVVWVVAVVVAGWVVWVVAVVVAGWVVWAVAVAVAVAVAGRNPSNEVLWASLYYLKQVKHSPRV